jgi:hypothetical protein
LRNGSIACHACLRAATATARSAQADLLAKYTSEALVSKQAEAKSLLNIRH